MDLRNVCKQRFDSDSTTTFVYDFKNRNILVLEQLTKASPFLVVLVCAMHYSLIPNNITVFKGFRKSFVL